ncbi:MAG: hypothetical protein K6G88_14605 [Lachnospiraceae bacterium]|nr:hypothetical protein [Lachnospiraceae bacterium]
MNKRVMAASLAAVAAVTMFTGCGRKTGEESVTAMEDITVVQEKSSNTDETKKVSKTVMRGKKPSDLNLKNGYYTVNAVVKEEENKELLVPECNMVVNYADCDVILKIADSQYDKIKVSAKEYDNLFADDEEAGEPTFQIPLKAFDREIKISLINSSNKEEKPVVLSVVFDSNSIKLLEEHTGENITEKTVDGPQEK